LGVGNWNHHNGRDVNSASLDGSKTSGDPEKSSLAYAKPDINESDLGDLNSDNDQKEVTSPFQRLDLDTQRTLASSPEHGWRGWNNNPSSPTSFALGWSTFVPKGVSASVFSSGEHSSSPLVLTPEGKHSEAAAAAAEKPAERR